MGSNRLATHVGSRLVCLKFAKTVHFLSFVCERRKKERRKKMNKIKIFKIGFSNQLTVNGTFGVDTALKY